MKIILLGPPGSGKGVQSKLLAEQHHLKHISTGDILRKIAQEPTEEGKQIKELLEKGQFVPDELIINLLKKEINEDFILDGFPRTLNQAEALKQITTIGLVIFLEVPHEEIIRRAISRSQCPKCGKIYGADIPPKEKGICDKCKIPLTIRDDDKEETVRERLNVYQEKTLPILEFYKKENLLEKINGVGPIDEIQKRINNKLFKLKNF